MTNPTTVNAGTDRWQVLRLLVARKTVLISLIVLIVLVAAALLAPWVSPYDPFKLSIMNRLKAPGAVHWFGTDDFGRDVFSRVIYGGRLSLMVGFSVVIVSSVLGIALGLIAGFFRSADKFVSRLIDAMMAFPDILLAISLVAALGPSLVNVVIALGIVYTPRLARIVRASTLVIRELPFVEAARALGVSTGASSRCTCCATCCRPFWCKAPSSSPTRSWPKPACRSWAWASRPTSPPGAP